MEEGGLIFNLLLKGKKKKKTLLQVSSFIDFTTSMTEQHATVIMLT